MTYGYEANEVPGEIGRYGQATVQHVEGRRVRSRWASRRRRRMLVAAEAITVVAAAMALAASGWFESRIVLPATFVGLATLMAVLGTQVNIAARWVVGLTSLDERQRAEQARARMIGHRVTSAVLLLAMLVAMVLSGSEISVPVLMLAPAIWVLAILHACFPAGYLAWTLPDEMLDEDDHPEGI